MLSGARFGSAAFIPRVPLLIVSALLAFLSAGLWSSTRLRALEEFVSSDRPYTLSLFSALLSASVGPPARPIGFDDSRQAWEFDDRGGMVPRSGLDIRDVPARGDAKVLTSIDPGVCWLWFAASRVGIPLSVAGIAKLQIGADFVALLLAVALAWRLAGPLAGSLAGVMYGSSEIVTESALTPAYYYWSIPAALIAGHLLVSFFRRDRAMLRWSAVSGFLALLIWLRVMWFPVAVAAQGIPPAFRVKRRWLLTVVGTGLIVAGYAGLLFRARGTKLPDLAHPRSELWHALYIGLGWYQNFGPIEWRDGYAITLASRAGISREDVGRYDAFLRKLFLTEIRRSPFKYALTLLRRMGDFVDVGRIGVFPLRRPPGLWWVGWLFIAGSAGIVFSASFECSRELRSVFLAYFLTVAVWALFVPPQTNYASETVGLLYPVAASALVTAARRILQPSPRGNEGQIEGETAPGDGV